tara:strand:- start:118 stop:381 length:264 start_codon:yes stop_codon:yes gene_type:complete
MSLDNWITREPPAEECPKHAGEDADHCQGCYDERNRSAGKLPGTVDQQHAEYLREQIRNEVERGEHEESDSRQDAGATTDDLIGGNT